MLAPQKNRAGQRTYRKRDVEMVLRIKELLYEDQYTIAGAKKKLSSDLRGASKLKVVTPEMNASLSTAPDEMMPAALLSSLTSPDDQMLLTATAPREQANTSEFGLGEASAALTGERRVALHRLKEQLHDLLVLLERGDAEPNR